MSEGREFDTILDRLNTVADALDANDTATVWLMNMPAAPTLLNNMPAHLSYIVITYYCDQARTWRNAGYSVFTDCDRAYQDYGAPHIIVLRADKQSAAAQAMLATACAYPAPGGHVLAWAPNDAGGKQLPKYVGQLGLSYRKEGRHHCSFVTAHYDRVGLDNHAQTAMRAAGNFQLNEEGYYACPGLHSWRKADTGSAMLAAHLPATLTGDGADFGCGWGYLSCQLIPGMQDKKRLYMLDNDARALQAAAMNLAATTGAENIDWHSLWRDMRNPRDMPADLDWIAMNPPFHDGRSEDIALGRAFIAGAARSLRKGGGLYMVANRKLAYEDDLKRDFAAVDKLFEDNGYKIFYARK